MFNPHHHHQQQQQQQQFHQYLWQIQQLFQQQQQRHHQTPAPPPMPLPIPTAQPVSAHHLSRHRPAARPMAVPAPVPPPPRRDSLCQAAQTIIAPNPLQQGAVLMQQMQASGMQGFAMGGQQFTQFFSSGARTSLLGPVPMGVALQTPHMAFPRPFAPHGRSFSCTQDFHSRLPDRKRENEMRIPNSRVGQSESRGDGGCQSSDQPVAKKTRTDESGDPAHSELTPCAEDKSPDADEGPMSSVSRDQSPLGKAGDSDGADKELDRGGAEDPAEEFTMGSQGHDEAHEATAESSSKFCCYICNISCHNQQTFQSHMNSLMHQQKMMEIQHMSNACLVTLLVTLQEVRRDGEKLWCSTCHHDFTCSITEHRGSRRHKLLSSLSSTGCTVCRQNFKTAQEFVEHMQSAEHQQRAQQLEVSLEDLNKDDELDVLGSSFLSPAVSFQCQLCNQFFACDSAARHAHCKSRQHVLNLKRSSPPDQHQGPAETTEGEVTLTPAQSPAITTSLPPADPAPATTCPPDQVMTRESQEEELEEDAGEASD